MLSRSEFIKGFKTGLPVCLGYAPVSFAFAVSLAGQLPWYVILLFSLSNFTSAGQAAGSSLMVQGAPLPEMGLTVLLIAHDLAVVKQVSHRIGVMHRGRLVEMAEAEELFRCPLHPYTRSLLSAIPIADPVAEKKRRRILYTPPEEEDGQMRQIKPGHWVFCREGEQPF